MNDYSTTVTNKQLYVTYIIGGQAGVFINWLSNGCNESPEEVATFYWLIRLNFKT